jgi:dTDP-4-amino-4,6-dideoxygalactose transaminase
MTVPFLNLKNTYLELKQEVDNAISRVLISGQYIGGEEVVSFEKSYAEYSKTKYCIGVANGLDALHLTLLAMDVGPGDEVIVPSNTYIATWLAVSMCGATIVPVEPSYLTHNIDPDLIEASITERTKVILPVHLYGNPVDLQSVIGIARKHNLLVLEDAAQSHGASYNNLPIGGHGDAVAWSFYPGKNLGAFGDGGAITTNNSKIAARVNALRNYGSRIKYENEIKGFNSRLDPLQAAVLSVKLQHLDSWNNRRSQIAKRYLNELKDLPISLPKIDENSIHAWHLFVIRTKTRNELQKYLHINNIATLIHYPIPPHLQPAYSDLNYNNGAFPKAEILANEILSIPIGPHLSNDDVTYVIAHMKKFYDA